MIIEPPKSVPSIAPSNSNGKDKTAPAPVANSLDKTEARLKHLAHLADIVTNAREHFWSRMLNRDDGCSDLDELLQRDCKYPNPSQIGPEFYRNLYDNFSLANRVVKLMPVECWQRTPEVFEDEDSDQVTPFEEAWDNLSRELATGSNSFYQDEEGALVWEYLKRLDILSGVGTFGVMLLGIDDGKNLQDPVEGVEVLTDTKVKDNQGNVRNVSVVIPDSPPHTNDVLRMDSLYAEDSNRKDALADNCYWDRSQEVMLADSKLVVNRYTGVVNPRSVSLASQQTRNRVSRNDQYPAAAAAPTEGTGASPPSGTMGVPGAGPFVQGTDGTYDRTSGMGMAFPAGASLAGTDQQYYGVQFGPSEVFSDRPAKQERRLLFLRVFDESLVQVVRYEWNIRNPRFGLPVMYRITLNDPRQPHTGVGLPLATVYVHWSRVIHAADNLHSSEIFGIPRLKPVLEHILPLRKMYAADGQAYWKNAFAGLSIETHPQLGPDIDIEQMGGASKLREQVDRFRDPTTNEALLLIGASAKTIPPAVTDPTPHVAVQIEGICIQLGCPVPVFKGYEIGEQASENNAQAWNERKMERNLNHITPRLVVPFVDRLIAVGVLPAPKKKRIDLGKRDGQTTVGHDVPPLNPVLTAPAAAPKPGGGGGGSNGAPPSGAPKPPQAGGGVPKPGAGAVPKQPAITGPKPPQPAATANRWQPSDYRRGYRLIRNANAVPKPGEDEAAFAQRKDKVVGVETEAGYSIRWPDLDAMTKTEKAQLALIETQTDSAYIAGGNDQLIHPMDYLTRIRHYTEEEAESILTASVEGKEQQQDDLEAQAAEQGLEPIPPPGFQKPGQELPPQIAVGPGEKIHHADDLQPGSPLEGQKIAKGHIAPMTHPGGGGATGQLPPNGPPLGAGKGASPFRAGTEKKPAFNLLLNWCNQYGGTTCKEGSAGWHAQRAKEGHPPSLTHPTPAPSSTTAGAPKVKVERGGKSIHTPQSLAREIKALQERGDVKLHELTEMTTKIASLKVGQIKELKKELGTTAGSGTKATMASAIARRHLPLGEKGTPKPPTTEQSETSAPRSTFAPTVPLEHRLANLREDEKYSRVSFVDRVVQSVAAQMDNRHNLLSTNPNYRPINREAVFRAIKGNSSGDNEALDHHLRQTLQHFHEDSGGQRSLTADEFYKLSKHLEYRAASATNPTDQHAIPENAADKINASRSRGEMGRAVREAGGSSPIYRLKKEALAPPPKIEESLSPAEKRFAEKKANIERVYGDKFPDAVAQHYIAYHGIDRPHAVAVKETLEKFADPDPTTKQWLREELPKIADRKAATAAGRGLLTRKEFSQLARERQVTSEIGKGRVTHQDVYNHLIVANSIPRAGLGGILELVLNAALGMVEDTVGDDHYLTDNQVCHLTSVVNGLVASDSSVRNGLRSHRAIKNDLIDAGEELAKSPLCMPGYGAIDIKNDGSGHVWWNGGDSDGEGFDDQVKRLLLAIPGVTKVTYRQEIPPPREVGEDTGSPLWDEVWVNDGSDYRKNYSTPPILEDEDDEEEAL